jgi:hypothetical protein
MSWLGNLINKLVNDLALDSYLELGVAAGHCFNEVKCAKKIGVDCTNDNIWKVNGVINKTTDDFFASLDIDQSKFDLIFIDADHHKNSVKKDFLNSCKFLNKNGIIILHDICPLSEGDKSFSFCGTAYEFWIELVDLFPENTFTYIHSPDDREGSIGIFFNNSKKINISD